jgi:phosphoribosylcarboxyaminoimidazole (NCAIR) mutase
MPPGVPVATVGIGKPGAKNAALLAVQILSTADPKLQKKFLDYKEKMADQVRQKNQKLQEKL